MSQEKKMKQTVESAHGGENPQKKQMKQKQTVESGHGGEIPQKKKMKQTVESVHGAENPRNDEDVAILQGILDYHSKNGRYPFSNLNDFHNSLQSSLQANVSASQLMHRIEGLKEKYVKRELCRKIWGDVGAEKTVGEQCNNADINVNVEVVGEEVQDLSMYPYLKETFEFLTTGMSPELGETIAETIAKEGLRLLGNSKVKEMDEECRKLKVEEIMLRSKKFELMRNQIKLIMDTVIQDYSIFSSLGLCLSTDME